MSGPLPRIRAGLSFKEPIDPISDDRTVVLGLHGNEELRSLYEVELIISVYLDGLHVCFGFLIRLCTHCTIECIKSQYQKGIDTPPL